jgi:prenyltransferase beta subunit
MRCWQLLTVAPVSSFKSISTSFDQQFHDTFVTINRYRDEIEKTVAAVSLLYVQGVKHITTELRETGIVQWRSKCTTRHVVKIWLTYIR